MLDADGDGMISQEELMAVLGEPLNQMEQQANQLMSISEEDLPPQPAAVMKIFKKLQNVTVPQVKDALLPAAMDGSLDKAKYCAVVKELGTKMMEEEDIFAQSMAMNPEMEVMPPAAKAMLEETLNQCKATFAETSEELYGASFDLFAVDGKMNAQQLDTSLTLLLPKTAEEKFNQIWTMIDTDGDSKITDEEMKAFINKFMDMCIAIGHYTISVYKTLGEALVAKVATVCIEAKDPNGLTFQQAIEIAQEGPNYAMKVIAGGN